MQVEPDPELEVERGARDASQRPSRRRETDDDRRRHGRQRSAAKLASSSMYLLVACVIVGWFLGFEAVLACAALAIVVGIVALRKMRALGAPLTEPPDATPMERRTVRMCRRGRVHAWIGLVGGALFLLGTLALVVAAAAAFGSA